MRSAAGSPFRLLALGLLLGLLPLAHAHSHMVCTGARVVTVHDVHLVVEEVAYDQGGGHALAFLLYLESNGEPGLQRGGISIFAERDWCGDSVYPDFFVERGSI